MLLDLPVVLHACSIENFLRSFLMFGPIERPRERALPVNKKKWRVVFLVGSFLAFVCAWGMSLDGWTLLKIFSTVFFIVFNWLWGLKKTCIRGFHLNNVAIIEESSGCFSSHSRLVAFLLFVALYVSQFPQSPHTLTTSYADDFTISVTAETTCGATATLTTQAAEVTQWASDRELQISAQKSTVTLFSSQTRELNTHPSIPFNNTTLPHENTYKASQSLHRRCLFSRVFPPDETLEVF